MGFKLDEIRENGSPELKGIIYWLLHGDFKKDIKLPKEDKNDEPKH